jgi:hypothetical protein
MGNVLREIVKMEKEPINTMMESVMLVDGKMASFMEKELMFLKMGINMRVAM